MAYYLVRADPQPDQMPELYNRLNDGDIESLEPFGPSLTVGLRGARFDRETGDAVWEAEDTGESPLTAERAVLTNYFEEISVEPVGYGEGWSEIETLPSLWSELV